MATKCAFRNVFFLPFFFICEYTLFNFIWYFVLLTRIFMAAIARYLWSRLCNQRIA